MVRITLIFVALSLLVACGELRTLRDDMLTPAPDAALISVNRTGVDAWLTDMQRLRQLTPEKQQTVLTGREKQFIDMPNHRNRMGVVVLLIAGDESLRDRRRARKLLRDYEPLPPDDTDREFLRLLKQYLDDQEQDAQKLSVLWKQVTEQNNRISELEQQQKALTNIEQKIQQRDTAPVKDDVR